MENSVFFRKNSTLTPELHKIVKCLIYKISKTLFDLFFSSDERKLIERFLNSEKYYIQLLKNGITEYLSNLPENVGASISDFLIILKKILDLHENRIYPHILKCNLDAVKICSSIKLHIDSSDFKVYFKYAAHLSEALENLFQTCVSILISPL